MTEKTNMTHITTGKVIDSAPSGLRAQLQRHGFALISVTGLAGLIVAPFLISDFYVSLFIEILIFAILASGINLLLGYTNLISLGHAAFFGVGAYTTAVCSTFWDLPVGLGMLASTCIAFALAYLIGLLCVRTKAVNFLLLTLAFGQMFYALAEKTRLTGGDDGITGIPRIDLAVFGLDTDQDRVFYFFVLFIFVAALVCLRRVVVSPFGRVLVGIRENEKRMSAMGYNTYPYKALAFGLAGMLGGLAGSLWVQLTFFVNPQIMTWQTAGEALFMVIIGGSQAFFGPLLGVAFYVIAKVVLADLTDAYLMVFGLLFVLVVAFFRGGLAGLAINVLKRFGLVDDMGGSR